VTSLWKFLLVNPTFHADVAILIAAAQNGME
jgi:hypothetical protein